MSQQPLTNWIDQMTLDESKAYLQQGKPQEALSGLTQLIKAYPANQEVAELFAKATQLLTPQAVIPTSLPYQPHQPQMTPSPQFQQPLVANYPNYNYPQQPGQFYYPPQVPQPFMYNQQPVIGPFFTPAVPQVLPSKAGLEFKYFALWVLPVVAIGIVLSIIISGMEHSTYYIGPELSQAQNTHDTILLIEFWGSVLLVVGTSLWAASDMVAARAKHGKKVFDKEISHPLVIFLECIIIWFLAWPVFLAKRKIAQLKYGRW